jgi:hypothetical protein
LLDLLRQTAERRGHAEPTIAGFTDWVRRYIFFHGKRHPRELGRSEILQFLEYVARSDTDPLIALHCGYAALDFLYREVLCLDLGELPLPRLCYLRYLVRFFGAEPEGEFVSRMTPESRAPWRSSHARRAHFGSATALSSGPSTAKPSPRLLLKPLPLTVRLSPSTRERLPLGVKRK